MLNDREKLKTRIILARSVRIDPDSVKIVDCDEESEDSLYIIENFKGMNFVMAFREVPTTKLVLQQLKDLYLSLVEMSFDEEFKEEESVN
jgi:hypothetical protein